MSNISEEKNSSKDGENGIGEESKENEEEEKESEENEGEEEQKEDDNSKKSSNKESKKSESKKSESKKSLSKKSESKKSESKKSESKKSESKKSESKKSEIKKSESKKSENSKKIITVTQKNSNAPSQNEKINSKNSSSKLSRKSNKIIIDANAKNNLPTFNQFMKLDPNEDINAPSIHYSEKYAKSQKSFNSIPALPMFNQLMKSEPNMDLNVPSVHYSEKYGKNTKKGEYKIEEKKNSEKEKEKIGKKKEENQEKEEIEEDFPTFEVYIKSDPDKLISFQNINFNRRYLEFNKEETKSIKSKKSKITGDSKKSKASSTLYMYQDIINGNPDKPYKLKEIDYNQRYGNIEKESKKSNKSIKSAKLELIGNVASERVIVSDENEKENLPKLLCSICNKFPLRPSVCTECKNIFCSECLKDKSKCQKCNSIYKHEGLNEELNKLFLSCRIICSYVQCGCIEQLTPKELLNHEESCKNKKIICENCNEKMEYEKYLSHYNECKLNTEECEICGYKDNIREFEKTKKKIEHIKHILLPEIETIVKKEVEKAIISINDSLDQREANKEPKDDKTEEEFRKKLLDIQQLLLNIQPKDFLDKKDDIGTMTKASYLDRKIKNIKLILTLPSKIDNSFESNSKYCVIHSFKNDNFIIYPNMKYGINSYNLATNKDINILPNAFESNITCMSSCFNAKKSLTYFAAASYDRNIKIYSVEDGFKKIKTYKEIFDDYSNFALDLYCSNNQLILLAGNENLKQIKVLFPDEDKEKEQSLIKTMIYKNKILCLIHNPGNEEEFFIGSEEGIHLYNIFNLLGEGDDKNKNIEPEKDFIDKNEDKSKHVCITFIQEDKNYVIEGDSIGIVRIWSIKDGELKKKIKRGILKDQISSLDSWSGRFIIGGTRDGKLVIFDIFDEIALAEFGEHKGYVYCVKVAENWKYEKIITSCGFDGELKIWASIEN